MEWPIIRLYSDDRLLNDEWQNRGSTDIVRRWSQRQAHFIDEISGRFSSAQRKKAPHIIPHSTYTHFFRHFLFLIRILLHLIEIAAAELDIFYFSQIGRGGYRLVSDEARSSERGACVEPNNVLHCHGRASRGVCGYRSSDNTRLSGAG